MNEIVDGVLMITEWDQMSKDPLPEGTAVQFGGQVLEDILVGKPPPAEIVERMSE